jgi:hypothetical protein
MAVVVDVPEGQSIGLEEFSERFRAEAFDTSDTQSLAAAAPMLAALARNRTFLADMVIKELETNLVFQGEKNNYSPQVIMLQKEENYFIRANLWPSPADEIYKQNRPETFFYHVPHDHNFNLLTVGYLGPGYDSDEYDYCHEEVGGYPGEAIEPTFVERQRLTQGKVVLYRAGKDVHAQLPPESLSVTLNVVDASPQVFFREQYVFQEDLRSLRCVIGLRCNPALFSLAAIVGGEEAQDRLLHIYAQHDSDYVAMQALNALGQAAVDKESAMKVFANGTGSPSQLIREWSQRQLSRF